LKAIIISVGNELTSGQVVDTNSAYLARRLSQLGVETVEHITLPDDRSIVGEALKSASRRAEVIIVSGGLGPTADDVTRQAAADALGVDLCLDEHCLAELEAFFARRGVKMAPANRIQAMIPRGAEAMDNPSGTAPGIAAKLGQAMLFVVPGVPHEMRRMFDKQVVPRLGPSDSAIAHEIVHTFGAGESQIASMIEDLMRARGPISIGTTVAAGVVSVRITARGDDAERASRLAQEASDQVRRRLGEYVFGVGQTTTLGSVVGDMLRRASQSVSTAESCTGGMLGAMITAVPGSSDYYLGGFVCYADRAKVQLLDVPAGLLERHGAVSEQVAAAMAEGCRRRLASDWSVATTGIAGPTGGSKLKPVGLVYIAVGGPGGTEVHRHIFSGDRDTVRMRSCLAGLNYLRLKLAE